VLNVVSEEKFTMFAETGRGGRRSCVLVGVGELHVEFGECELNELAAVADEGVQDTVDVGFVVVGVVGRRERASTRLRRRRTIRDELYALARCTQRPRKRVQQLEKRC